MRLWYARRAVPWTALLACAGVAVALTVVMHLRESASWVLLPMAVGVTAAASGFAFDDKAVAVTAVTPRGSRWNRSTRLGVGSLPVLVWVLVLAVVPAEVPLETAGWLLVGAAGCLLALGVAATAARRHVAAPGGQVAATVVVLVMVPLVLGPFLQWDPVFPLGAFPDWVAGLWAGLAAAGAALCAHALRPGLR